MSTTVGAFVVGFELGHSERPDAQIAWAGKVRVPILWVTGGWLTKKSKNNTAREASETKRLVERMLVVHDAG